MERRGCRQTSTLRAESSSIFLDTYLGRSKKTLLAGYQTSSNSRIESSVLNTGASFLWLEAQVANSVYWDYGLTEFKPWPWSSI